MNSISFPNIFNRTTTNVVQDKEASKQNLSLTILSNKNEMFGDPYFGTNLKKFLFDQNDIILEDLIVDDINSAIKLFVPQLTVTRNDITVDSTTKGEIIITIKAINKSDYSLDTHNIVARENEA